MPMLDPFPEFAILMKDPDQGTINVIDVYGP